MFFTLTPIRFLHRAMDLYGRKVGVISGERHFTYAEFGERCERLASTLTGAGIQPGDRIGYLSFNNHQLLEGYYGVIQAHAIVMPLNVRLAPPEIVEILKHSGARMLFVEADCAALLPVIRNSCPKLETIVSLGDALPGTDSAYEDFIAQGQPERADIRNYDENAPAELFYTSGSTGTPKGVVLSHRTLYLHALDVTQGMAYDDTEVELHTIPLFHANGWGRPQTATMLGATQVMVRRFEPAAVLGLIQKHRATFMALVPTMAMALISAPNLRHFDLSSMRLIMIGGAASSPSLIERMEKVFGCSVIAGYGLSETAPVLTTGRPKSTMRFESDEERYRYQAAAGLPYPGVELRVVDHNGRDVPRDGNTMGEIVARGDHIMEGYYRDPQGTQEAMRDGWFHTGDMAVWDEETYIQIVDRKKEVIISGGENISSLEVERAISAHPDVLECAVVSAPDDTWGEVPAALVVRRMGSKLTAAELLKFLEGRLGRFKIPRKVEVQEDPLPKTGTGKIRKLALREKFWAGRQVRVHGG